MKSIKEAYREFVDTRHGAEAYRKFKRVLYSTQDSLVQTLDTHILHLLPAVQRESVRVCDIGGGDGDRANRIIAFLHGKFHNRYELDLVEQSRFYIERFKRRQLGPFCKTRVHHGLFEEAPLSRRYFDLALLIHSIFAFANGQAIEKVLSLRRKTGRIVVVSNAPASFLGGLKRLVDEDFEDKRYEIDDLQCSLNNLGIRFIAKSFETTWAIENSRWEQEVNLILDWISLGRFNSFHESRKRGIYTYIAGMTKRDKSRVLFREEETVLVIPDADLQECE